MAGLINDVKMTCLRIAGNNVTDITRDTAQVGCTKVTRAEAAALLAEMDKAPEQFDFKITSQSTDREYISFYIHEKGNGWAAASPKAGEGYYGAPGGFGVIQSLSLCLSKSKAEKLMRFLADQLKFSVSGSGQQSYIIEYLEKPSGRWIRSGNVTANGTFDSFEHACRVATQQERDIPGYVYRARAI